MMEKIENFRLLWAGGGWAMQTRTHTCSFCEIYSVSLFEILERLRFTFTPNGSREFVPRDQVFLLIVVFCLLLVLKNK